MFVDFDDVFNNRPQTNLKVPDALIAYLNKSLPKGLKYIADKEGNCILASDEAPIKLNGIKLAPNDDQKKELGNEYTLQDILDYAYNSQQKIPVELEKEGYIVINGQEIAIDRINYKPWMPVHYVSGSFCVVPPKFPAPFEIEIGSKDTNMRLLIHREPSRSASIAKFASETESPLYIEYSLNEKTGALKMSMSLHTAYAHTVQEIIDAATIYNGFVSGTGALAGYAVGGKLTGPNTKSFDESSIEFWMKVAQLEKLLESNFKPPKDGLTFETIYLVEELYQNLKKQNPIRETNKIDSLDGEWSFEEEDKVRNSLGEPVVFEFQGTKSFELFGIKKTLPCLIRLFNSKLSNVSKKNKTTKLTLEDIDSGKQRYTVSMCFLNEEALKQYRETRGESSWKQFNDAKRVRDYMDDEKANG